jgi:3-hydroxyisobutyrate dehydrogenase
MINPQSTLAGTASNSVDRPAPEVGFAGLGRIGTQMVERLLAESMPVSIWNRSTSKCAALQAHGASTAASLAGLAQTCSIICLCLSDTAAVEKVVFAEDGLYPALRRGSLIIDLSSISPQKTLEFAKRLHAERGVGWLDAPVSGGLPAARAGTLTVFAGGDAEHLQQAAPVLSLLAKRVTHMGGSGAGQLAKSCNQMLVASQVAVIAEMLAFARRAGVDVAQLPQAMAGGFADSLPLQIFGTRMALRQTTPSVGAMEVMLKDIDQSTALARAVGSPTPVVAAAAEVYRQAVSHPGLGPQTDLCSLIQLYDHAS